MKKLLILAIAMAAALSSCEKDNDSINENLVETDVVTATINSFPKETLNADEIASIIWMREEEKLAYDVYVTLNGLWSTNIYANISSSEQRHTGAVLTLLNKYDLTDPVGNNAVGVFTDTTLQNLYTQLVAQGSASALDGYTVGATIEDLDISDLNTWLTKVDNQDITYVYENLNRGSRNHMRAFYGRILSAGGSYSAQYISQTDLDAIINSPKETGAW